MPWNSQQGGGGPWGSSGGPNPWGSGGRGGGPSAPDLEEMLRRSQDRFRRIMPRGMGGGRGIALIVAAIAVLWMLTGIYRVEPDEEGVVKRFGAYVRSAGPGLHFHLPAPIETVLIPQVTRINRVEVGYVSSGEGRGPPQRDIPEESLMLTGDENIIDIDFTVLWRISNAADFLFNLRDPEQTVKTAAESAMREIIGRTAIQPALTQERNQIAADTRVKLQSILDEYGAGIEVAEVQLLDVSPPAPVIDAFNEVQRAEADQQRSRNEAETYRNDIIPRARGEAERVVQEASAYREQIVNQAQGDAQRFRSVLESYRQAPEVTARRFYLETMEDVLRGANKVIIDQKNGAGPGVVPYLPLPELQRRAAQPQPPAQEKPQ